MARDLAGQRFGKLIAIKICGRSKCGDRIWLCQCDCGNTSEIRTSSLTPKGTKSCGCLIGQATGKKLAKPKVQLNCENCHQQFFVHQSEVKARKCCSRKCRYQYMRANKAPNAGGGEWMKGSKNINWRDGKSKERHAQRDADGAELRRWRRQIYYNNSYMCQRCKTPPIKSRQLVAHHIAPWSFFPELRFEINNGITLCIQCHKALHTLVPLKNMDKDGIYLKAFIEECP